MILADTSVWIDHFRSADPRLTEMLYQNLVTMHPWVVGELACGNLRDRKKTLSFLRELPSASVVSGDEVLELIERHKLMGKGIGLIDTQLIASAAIDSHELWTNDLRQLRIAQSLGIVAKTPLRRH